jgi:kynurenine formamidase
MPPILTRGVLIDVARAKGVEILPDSYGITVEDISGALSQQDTTLQTGDVVLIRTGQMAGWPDRVRPAELEAGITLATARWLADREPVAVGSDSSAVEVAPSGVAGSPQPVHIHLISERGIYILEWIYLEELASARAYEFFFVCLPLKIRGATGSWVRPVAVV